MSIATAITALQQRIQDAYTALDEMGATLPATLNTTNLPNTIKTIPTGEGGGSAEPAPVGLNGSGDDVLFIDYDGNVLYKYSKADALALTSLPALPSHDGLTCQGWNFTLEEMKARVNGVGVCIVGPMYTTSDGKTKLKIILHSPKFSSVKIVFKQTKTNGVELDWGDGSEVETFSAANSNINATHEYSAPSFPATYTISLAPVSGTFQFPSQVFGTSGSNSASNPKDAVSSRLVEANIGNSMTGFGTSVFSGCSNLNAISMPSTVTAFGTQVFQYCHSLKVFIFPKNNSVKALAYQMFGSCESLAYVSMPANIDNITSNAVFGSTTQRIISLPQTLASGSTTIGEAFFGTTALQKIALPSNLTLLGKYAFKEIASLTEVIMPDTLETIKDSSFLKCTALPQLVFSENITKIEANAFSNCYALQLFDFRKAKAVPTLENTSAFTNAGTSMTREIVVPDELYEDWIAANNWNSSTNSIVSTIIKASESSLGVLA